METIEDIILEAGWSGPPNRREWFAHPLSIIVKDQQTITLFSYLGEISFESLKATIAMQGRLIDALYHEALGWKVQWEELRADYYDDIAKECNDY